MPASAASPPSAEQSQGAQRPASPAARQSASQQCTSARHSATQLPAAAMPAPAAACSRLELPSGEQLEVLQDLLDAVLPLPGSVQPGAAPPAAAPGASPEPPQHQLGSRSASPSGPRPGAAASSARSSAVSKSKTPSKQQVEEEEAAEAEAKAAALAAGAAAAAAEAARLAELARPPAALDGQLLCLALDLPRPELSAALQRLQVREVPASFSTTTFVQCRSLIARRANALPQSQCTLATRLQASVLHHALELARRSGAAAEVWASELVTGLTAELDQRLRGHRPRAGRVEEEVRRVGGGLEAGGQQRWLLLSDLAAPAQDGSKDWLAAAEPIPAVAAEQAQNPRRRRAPWSWWDRSAACRGTSSARRRLRQHRRSRQPAGSRSWRLTALQRRSGCCSTSACWAPASAAPPSTSGAAACQLCKQADARVADLLKGRAGHPGGKEAALPAQQRCPTWFWLHACLLLPPGSASWRACAPRCSSSWRQPGRGRPGGWRTAADSCWTPAPSLGARSCAPSSRAASTQRTLLRCTGEALSARQPLQVTDLQRLSGARWQPGARCLLPAPPSVCHLPPGCFPCAAPGSCSPGD
jgi:hypothetical protein